MDSVSAQTGFVTATCATKSSTTNLNWSQQVAVGVGLGRVVVPEIRERNNTHSFKKTTIYQYDIDH